MEVTTMFAVTLTKKNAKAGSQYFIVTQIRRDEFVSPAVFHGVGFWSITYPLKRLKVDIQPEEITEVWIPWEKIDHVESLVYRHKIESAHK